MSKNLRNFIGLLDSESNTVEQLEKNRKTLREMVSTKGYYFTEAAFNSLSKTLRAEIRDILKGIPELQWIHESQEKANSQKEVERVIGSTKFSELVKDSANKTAVQVLTELVAAINERLEKNSATVHFQPYWRGVDGKAEKPQETAKK